MEMFDVIHKQYKKARKEYLKHKKWSELKSCLLIITASSVIGYFIVMALLYITVTALR